MLTNFLKTIGKRNLYLAIRLFILPGIFGLVLASTAQAQSINCDSGDSIQSTINSSPPAGLIVINFVGTCVETVSIRRDDVQLSGGGVGVIQGRIVTSGSRITFANLTVSGNGIIADTGTVLTTGVALNGPGSGNGISVQRGAAAAILNTSISGYGIGVLIVDSATAAFEGATISNSNTGVSARASTAQIRNSTINNASRFGLLATEHSMVRLVNSTIEVDAPALSSGEAAIAIFRQSSVRIMGSSNITNTNATGRGIILSQQSWIRQGNGTAVINSFANVLTVTRQSGADLRAFQATGNIVGGDKSYLELRNGNLTGNITLRRDTEIKFLDSGGIVTVTGDLICEDRESSHTLAAGTVIGGTADCTDFK